MLPIIQHYVPQFILRNFCQNGAEKLFVFDKETEKIFSANIKKVAAENGFYNYKDGNSVFSVEQDLSNLESSASSVFKKIISANSLSKITKNEKITLSIFVATQFLRTKQNRISLKQIDNLIIDHIKKRGGDPKNVKGFLAFEDDEEINKFAIMSLWQYVESLWTFFYERRWVLFESTEFLNYYISDNPVTLHNKEKKGIEGNLGIRSEGIEIYFPITPKLSIGIYDEFNQKIIKESYKLIKKEKLINKEISKKSKTRNKLIKDMIRGLETGSVVKSLKENVDFQNSLQVASSSRFIYSIDDKFDLVQKLIKTYPDLKNPPTIVQAN